MKSYNKLIVFFTVLIIPLLFMINGCEESEWVPAEDKVVIEAYLYTGESVDDIRITWMNSYASEDSICLPVNNAEVIIINNDQVYELELFPGDSGYYYFPGNLPVISGEEYSLEVKVNQEEITASTIVPAKPPDAEISDNIIYMKQIESFYDMRGMEWPDPVDITWDNPEQEYYFFVIDNLEENPELILPFMEEEEFSSRKFKFSMTTKPTQLDFYQIQPRSLTYFGQHMIRFFRVNEEYARLYETIEQDSRELNEPYTNINNGLGIFTAFACDSLYLEVKKGI